MVLADHAFFGGVGIAQKFVRCDPSQMLAARDIEHELLGSRVCLFVCDGAGIT